MTRNSSTKLRLREVLFGAALLTVLASSATATDTWDVLVIGAGISGLSAARSLQADGYQVLVLEARERVGGRIWSLPINSNKFIVDFGASWIHGITGNPIYTIVQDNKIATLPTNYESGTAYSKGKALTDAQVAAAANLYSAWYDYQAAQGNSAETDAPLGSTLAPFAKQEGLDAAEQDMLWFRVHGTVEEEYAGSVFDMSLQNWDSDTAPKGEDVIFPGGYSQIVSIVARNLTVHTGKAVASISYSTAASSVEVTTTDGTKYSAQAAVVTVPLGVLKAGGVAFIPALPAEKLASIKLLKMGLLQKVVLVFPSKFWDDTEWIERVPASPMRGRWVEFLNLHHYYKEPMLLCFNAADYAWQAENMTDAQFSAAAMEALREMYGADIPAPTEVHVSRWGKDPYSRGAYSFLGVGATPADRASLAQPVGKSLFFAGEATSQQYPSTVHGAYLSGQAAAKQVEAAGVKKSAPAGAPKATGAAGGSGRAGGALGWVLGGWAIGMLVVG